MTSKKTIENTKLIKLLSSFSSLEWKRFGRFVQSPYHNTNEQIVDLYYLLKKTYPFKDINKLDQEKIYKKIYKKENFKVSKFQNLCSDLYGLATDFLMDVHLAKKKRKKKKIIIDVLEERNYELFKNASQQLIKEVETQGYFLDSDDFLLLFQLNDQLYHHLRTDKFNINKKELEKSWKYLNAFFENVQIQFEAEDKSSQNFLNQKLNAKDSAINKLSALFQDIRELHKTKQLAFYFQVKEKVFKSWTKLKRKHKIDFMVHLINFAFTNKLIQEEVGHLEALNLYKKSIEEKLFVVNGRMRDIEFINISAIGFKFESIDWTNHFIESHKQYLPKETRNFLVPLAYAYHAIFSKYYNKVIHLLSGLNPQNNLIYLERIKKLLIRAYFEGVISGQEHYLNPLTYEIDSLRKMMVRNNKLSSLKIKANLNFLDLTKKLVSLYKDKSNKPRQIQLFESQLADTSPLTLRLWLEEKLMEIKNVAPNQKRQQND